MHSSVVFALFALAAAPRFPWTRTHELEPSPSPSPMDDPCMRWGLLASVLCPELVDGDIRGACTGCGPIVSRVLDACADTAPFPGTLCSGDCSEAATVAPTCGNCGECVETGDCEQCPPACIAYIHCFDPETGAVDPPPPYDGPMRTLSSCDDTQRLYHTHGCCSDDAWEDSLYVLV